MVFDLFNEFGIDNCKIELLEIYPCNSKMELEAREGYHQRLNECINKRMEGRAKKQYCQDNKDKIAQYMKTYNEANKEILAENQKAYYSKT
jgi:adenylate kinase family enzyme